MLHFQRLISSPCSYVLNIYLNLNHLESFIQTLFHIIKYTSDQRQIKSLKTLQHYVFGLKPGKGNIENNRKRRFHTKTFNPNLHATPTDTSTLGKFFFILHAKLKVVLQLYRLMP
ncbi:uncharacterized protein LOC124418639 [Lucilia cuprina]|uniref:uncharacterized protein LOC124418639 n=1 Tax=Lucilia cuprina TaxID=7375 RepID=UPI001F05F273|nr:uncharacterized protein LOC124418639 [Lucilia cuprina]